MPVLGTSIRPDFPEEEGWPRFAPGLFPSGAVIRGQSERRLAETPGSGIPFPAAWPRLRVGVFRPTRWRKQITEMATTRSVDWQTDEKEYRADHSSFRADVVVLTYLG